MDGVDFGHVELSGVPRGEGGGQDLFQAEGALDPVGSGAARQRQREPDLIRRPGGDGPRGGAVEDVSAVWWAAPGELGEHGRLTGACPGHDVVVGADGFDDLGVGEVVGMQGGVLQFEGGVAVGADRRRRPVPGFEE